MAQKLILPINNANLTASINTTAYTTAFGFGHYGSDLVSIKPSRIVYASGKGIVVATGWDNVCGNVVAIVYQDAYNHKTGKTQSITIRYFHLSSILVKKNQNVTKDTIIGSYGSTGQYVTGAHLHLEADTDTVAVLYTPTVTSSNFLRGTRQGAYAFSSKYNTVVNPLEYMHIKATAPDYQTYKTANDKYIRTEDKQLAYVS